MEKPIVLLNRTFTEEELTSLRQLAPNYRFLPPEAVTDFDQVEIALGWHPSLNQQLLDSPTSQLRWIQAYSAGVDDFDLGRLAAQNILLSNASGVHSIPITESVIAMILTYYRGITTASSAQTSHKWDTPGDLTELANKQVLLVGTGQIGQRLAKVLTAFDAKVYGINRSGRSLAHFQATYPQSQIDSVLNDMDIVVNILPLTTETQHFFHAERFKKMKEGVVFVNVGRGPSVDTEALVAACETKKIAYAALDVFEEEPLPKDHPLWALPNVLITPHISGMTIHYDARFLAIFKENLSCYLTNGELARNQVRLTNGY